MATATSTPASKNSKPWLSTACILCANNCGVKVQLSDDGQAISRTKGDDDHPGSQGYVCNKASRLNYYQNRDDRLLSPMRRRAGGSYESISWDVAIAEIASKLQAVVNQHGGDKIFYYGGGGQGNHLPGAYSRTTSAPLGIKWRSNALAQEKTGEFWVAERMFGGWNHGDFENAEVTIFLGKNPWQSHGIQRSRVALREMSKDPKRTLIVIDPKRTETADLADIHLAVKPARDAWLLSGMIATLVQEDLINHRWLAEHANGLQDVVATFANTSITDCADKCSIDEHLLRETTRRIAKAKSVALVEDLGIQMNRHSTLVSYLQRLLWVLTGNFGRDGTHYTANGLGGIGSGREGGVSPVLGERIIAGLVPCNVIAAEVLADHPNSYQAMIIESANPVHSLADSPSWRAAMRKLQLSVVIDIAMTESARQADYVLPATTQYEKAEATFFNFEFPNNYFHLRQPLFEPPASVLDEAEIHMRLAEALGFVPAGLEDELNNILATQGCAGFRTHIFAKLAENPSLMNIAPGLLYRTLGRSLPSGMQNGAALWALCHQYAVGNRETLEAAGHHGEGMDLGDALFDAMLNKPSGVIFSSETWDDVWARTPGGKVQLALPDMLEAAALLETEIPQEQTSDYPFLLSAGERRSFTANTIMRHPEWRRKDKQGALYINPEDAARLNLGEGSTARIATKRGELDVLIELNERMQRGHVSLPNGMGLDYPDADGNAAASGVSPNELTSSDMKDVFVGTPWHKSVPARIEAID